jgi:predicted alpha/beta-fold hydrolase
MSASAVSSVGMLVYLAPGNSTKKRVVGRELVRSWVLTLRKSKLLFNMFGSGILFTYFSKYPMKWFQWQVSRLRVFAAYVITFWLTQYTLHYMEYPHARFQRTFWNVHLVEKSRLRRLRFDPIPWLMNTHQQTLVGFVLGHLEWILFNRVTFRRETVQAYDGNDLFLDWFEHPDDEEDEEDEAARAERRRVKKKKQRMSDKQKATLPIVVIVHGLGDHRFIPYMKRLARACHRNGWRPVAYSYWRCDFGCTKDMVSIVNHLHKEWPDAPIIGTAFSAGGHILMRYLETVGKDTPMITALSFSGCFELAKTIRNVRENELASYAVYLNNQVRVCIRRHMDNDKRFRPTRDKDGNVVAPAFFDRKEFEKVVMGPHGFTGDAEKEYDRFLYEIGDYSGKNEGDEGGQYEFMKQTAGHYRLTAASEISKVGITTLILHADDDPIVSGSIIDWNQVPDNKNLIVLTTKRGGHCSWYQGLFPIGDAWSDRVAVKFISSVLESHSHTNFLVRVIRKSIRAEPNLKREVSMERLARICSAADMQSSGIPFKGGGNGRGNRNSKGYLLQR